GLAGALNTNLFREAASFDSAKTLYVVTGKKARQFIARTKRELLADFELKDAPAFVETKPIAKFCTEKFLSREVDKVTVLYTQFINTIINARLLGLCYRSAVSISRRSMRNPTQIKLSIQWLAMSSNLTPRRSST